MSILINKDGRQLGPYSLDEARALVLSGRLDATDWAWTDGATDWVHLKDAPGFSDAKPAPPAGASAPSTEEQELWRGHPSQILNAGIYVFWGAVLIVTLSGLFVLGVFSESPFWGSVILGVVALIALGNSAVAYLHLRAIEYVVTVQRVRVISGIFGKNIQEIELFRVKDTMANQSFFLRLFGLGTITVISGDERNPRVVLSGVPGAIDLREKMRQEVMTLRQRFGVREVDVM
ncbi:MAG TPA: PH domain-containing protein [Candidatus Methylacidiphilales bacterium]|jgi:membrane protein YdbS with pleckstrin-like domain|nr:PH domain-containing protein [Candidatus Methylacidiphilales bacterium]